MNDAISRSDVCSCCERLNSEKERIRITEIYISTAGHYNFYANIRYCPECGKMLKRYAKHLAEEQDGEEVYGTD